MLDLYYTDTYCTRSDSGRLGATSVDGFDGFDGDLCEVRTVLRIHERTQADDSSYEHPSDSCESALETE